LPSYQTAPHEDEKFYPGKAQAIAEEVLQNSLGVGGKNRVDDKMLEEWCDYEDDIRDLAKDLADTIKTKVRAELNLKRYKVVVQVSIIQNKSQGIHISSRCLWDKKHDNYASCQFKDDKITVSVVIFGVYAE
jgi:hypothetical protein